MCRNLELLVNLLEILSNSPGGGGGGTPYNGLYGEAPPERGTFVRVGISQADVYERAGKSVIQVSKRAFNFRVDNNSVFG